MNVGALGIAAVGVLGIAAWPVSADASDSGAAEPSGSESQVSVALVAAYGAGTKHEDSNVNRYGLGVGVRAGVTLGTPQLYVGGSFVKFFGFGVTIRGSATMRVERLANNVDPQNYTTADNLGTCS